MNDLSRLRTFSCAAAFYKGLIYVGQSSICNLMDSAAMVSICRHEIERGDFGLIFNMEVHESQFERLSVCQWT